MRVKRGRQGRGQGRGPSLTAEGTRRHTPYAKAMNTVRRRAAREGIKRREELARSGKRTESKEMVREARSRMYGEPTPESYREAERLAKIKPKNKPKNKPKKKPKSSPTKFRKWSEGVGGQGGT